IELVFVSGVREADGRSRSLPFCRPFHGLLVCLILVPSQIAGAIINQSAPDLDRIVFLTENQLHESSHRLANPLRHLGLNVAVHKAWTRESSATNLRGNKILICLAYPHAHNPRARCALAA